MLTVPLAFTARETEKSLVVGLALGREPAGDSWKGSSAFTPTVRENPGANGQKKSKQVHCEIWFVKVPARKVRLALWLSHLFRRSNLYGVQHHAPEPIASD